MLSYIFSWSTLWWLMLVLYVPACIGLIVIVLLQKGKGAGFAGAFGVGPGSETVFGPRMARSAPQKITHAMAGIFMAMALLMSIVGGRVTRGSAPELAPETQVTAGIDQILGQPEETPEEVPTMPVEGAAPAADAAAPAAAPDAAAPAPAADAAAPAADAAAPAADAAAPAADAAAPAADAAAPAADAAAAPVPAPAADAAAAPVEGAADAPAAGQ